MYPIRFGLLSMIAVLTPAFSQFAEAQDLEHLLSKGGYHLYKPLREDWGPGTVLLGKLSGGEIKVDRQICPSLFSSVRPHGATVVLPNYSGSSDTDFSVGIALLEKVIGPKNSTNLQAKYGAPRNVSITWGPLKEVSYFASDAFTAKGQLAEINPACRPTFADLRQRGQIRRVFVIDRAVMADKLDYKFRRGDVAKPSGGDIQGDLKLAGLISLNAKAGYKITDKTTLAVRKPLYVGYATPVRLDEFLPLSDLKLGLGVAKGGGGLARVVVSKPKSDLVISAR